VSHSGFKVLSIKRWDSQHTPRGAAGAPVAVLLGKPLAGREARRASPPRAQCKQSQARARRGDELCSSSSLHAQKHLGQLAMVSIR